MFAGGAFIGRAVPGVEPAEASASFGGGAFGAAPPGPGGGGFTSSTDAVLLSSPSRSTAGAHPGEGAKPCAEGGRAAGREAGDGSASLCCITTAGGAFTDKVAIGGASDAGGAFADVCAAGGALTVKGTAGGAQVGAVSLENTSFLR